MENMTDGYIDSLVVRSKALTEGANNATQQILGAVSVGAQLALSGKQQTVVEQIIAAVNSYNFLTQRLLRICPHRLNLIRMQHNQMRIMPYYPPLETYW